MKQKLLFLILLYGLIFLMYCTTGHGAPIYVRGSVSQEQLRPTGVKAQVIAQDPTYDVVSYTWLKAFCLEQYGNSITYRSNVADCDTQSQVLIGRLKETAIRSGAEHSPAIGLAHVWYMANVDGKQTKVGHALVIAKTELGWYLVDPTDGYKMTALEAYAHRAGITFILF